MRAFLPLRSICSILRRDLDLSLARRMGTAAPPTPSPVLRYVEGEERFQLRLLYNQKVFNFERSVNDPLQAITARISANVAKKAKKKQGFEGEVSLLLQNGSSWAPVSDLSSPATTLLQDLLAGRTKLAVQIGEEELQPITLNPPEVFSLKFFKSIFALQPILPIKLEASPNFNVRASEYLWEYSLNPNPNKREWKSTGCKDYIFIPGEDLVGARIRMTIRPSDGESNWGSPFTSELESPLSALPPQKPLFLHRADGIPPNRREDPNFLRVVSYNCLADCYATEAWFIASPKESLPADFRLPFLCRELGVYEADLYCLQEVEEKYFEVLLCPFLEKKQGMQGLLSSKVGNVKEGVALFYNPKKLKLLRKETVVVLEQLKGMEIWGRIAEVGNGIIKRLEERNTVLQVAFFECGNDVLVVANTHLYFHPDADHIRLLQTIGCVNYVERIVSELRDQFSEKKVSLLFCGDFNCTPEFSSFRFLQSGLVENEDFDWTSHPTEKLSPGLKVSHSLELKNSFPDHELTNITSCFEGCIDYILYQPKGLRLLSLYPPPKKSQLREMWGLAEERHVSLPNLHTPSDHLPLIADFQLCQGD